MVLCNASIIPACSRFPLIAHPLTYRRSAFEPKFIQGKLYFFVFINLGYHFDLPTAG